MVQSCPSLCDSMGCSMPGFPVLHQLLEHTQTMCIKLVMPSNHLILCCPLLLLPSIFPNIRSLPMSQHFTSGSQRNGASASSSVLPINIQGWFPLGLTAWISLQTKGLSRVFSNTTVWKHQFWDTQPSLWSNSPIYTWLLENHRYLLPKWCLRILSAVYICHSFPSKKQESLNFMVKII